MEKFSLAPEVLWRVGFRHLNKEQVATALYDIYSTLELLVGERIASEMTKNQRSEFERALAKSESAALSWLQSNIPWYQDVVRSEFATIERRLQLALDMHKEHSGSKR